MTNELHRPHLFIHSFTLSLIHSLEMLRTHTCGELRLTDDNKTATLSGWVQTIRDKGGVLWIDLRDRYGITQLLLEDGQTAPELFTIARSLGREFVLKATGTVIERKSKNPNIPTGDIELKVTALEVLNPAKLPPFLIEDETDGGDDLRMKYRYLDLTPEPRSTESRTAPPHGPANAGVHGWAEFH